MGEPWSIHRCSQSATIVRHMRPAASSKGITRMTENCHVLFYSSYALRVLHDIHQVIFDCIGIVVALVGLMPFDLPRSAGQLGQLRISAGDDEKYYARLWSYEKPQGLRMVRAHRRIFWNGISSTGLQHEEPLPTSSPSTL